MISKFAIPASKVGLSLFTARRMRRVPLFGITLHTTGSGLPKRAINEGKSPLLLGAKIYTESGGPHYIIGWDGKIIAIHDDERRLGAHAGITKSEHVAAYKDGSWIDKVSSRGKQLWLKRWPGRTSPIDLIPNRKLSSINDYWIGIEMIPVTPGGSTFWAKPYKKTRFTKAQYDAARQLIWDIAKRHKFPRGWQSSERLLGHSDLNPLARDTQALPLWDPGYHSGLFDIEYVKKAPLDIRSVGTLGLAGGLLFGIYYFLKKRGG